MKPLGLIALILASAAAQDAVNIHVEATARTGLFKPIYAYFGYDEPNYTYMKNGRKLVGELSALSPVPVYIRAHHLLCTGDGAPALKWGSTNAYTEDAQGKPVYNWTIVDRIFDTYIQAKAKPFVEIGFMPEALSTHPQPYTRHWPKPDDGTGWSYPPKDYDKWAELVRQWVLHSVERYGKTEVASWYWELWNEPDISYWRGTPEEYDHLYDVTAAAVKRALPEARIGGPATTGPASPKAAAFLDQFLEHCATSKTPLDFITYHAKGQPRVVDGHVRMGIGKNLLDIQRGFEIVGKYPQFRRLPIVLSESDPEGCAACSARTYPQNAYRNGLMYPSYTAAAMTKMIELADRYKATLDGMLTWAFEFEDQPYFDGFRTLATNGIDKPILNFFRMAGLLQNQRLQADSSGAVPLDTMLKSGVQVSPDVSAFATRSARVVSILVWNYHDDEAPGPAADVRLNLAALPLDVSRVLVEHYRIDETHSNAYTAWKQMGSPQNPTPEQYAELEAAGQLQLLDSPRWVSVAQGASSLEFALPRHAVSLVRISW
jgi:xylan 1,4-beta-xylosidase